MYKNNAYIVNILVAICAKLTSLLLDNVTPELRQYQATQSIREITLQFQDA